MTFFQATLPLAIVAVTLAQSNPPASSAMKNPLEGRPQAIEAGKKRFQEGCAVCHGGSGEGGRGPNLAESDPVRQMSDAQLFTTVRRGIPGTNMPAFAIPAEEIWAVVAFLRALSMPAYLTPVHGDVERGGHLFFGSYGCSGCHMIRGRGGFLGPDLTNIGGLRTATQLRQSLTDPNARRLPGFAGVSVILADGSKIEGVAKNRTNYSIEVLDAAGKLHAIDTRSVSAVNFREDSLMAPPNVPKLSPANLDDIVAFLSKQVLRPDALPGSSSDIREER